MKKTFMFKTMAMAAAVALAGISCSDKNAPAPDGSKLAAPNGAKFGEIRQQALADLTVAKTFKAEEGIDFETDKGTKVAIYPNCLRKQNGDPVSGNVDLKFIEIYDRGNMVAANKPLMGRNVEGKLEPLVTGGQFFIEAKQGSELLKPGGCSYNVAIPVSLTGGRDNAMSLWKGAIDADGNLTWDELTPAQEEGWLDGDRKGQEGESAYYNVFRSGTFNWTNVDRFWDYKEQKTVIKVQVPEAYDNKNSGVYITFEGEPNMLAQMDIYNKEGKYFTEHYGYVPVGKKVHVIFTSESAGKFVHAVKTVTIKANDTITIGESDLSTIEKDALVAKIKDLQ